MMDHLKYQDLFSQKNEIKQKLLLKALLGLVFQTKIFTVLALTEVWELETPKNWTSKNQCQEVWDSQL